MRILIIHDRYPASLQNGADLRVIHYVRRLRSRHRFDLAFLDAPSSRAGSDDPDPAKGLFDEVYGIERAPNAPVKGAGRLVRSFEPSAMFPPTPAMVELLERLTRSGRYDLVWSTGFHVLVNVPRPCPIPFVADVADDGAIEFLREIRNAQGLRSRAVLAKRLLMTILWQRRYWGPADATVFVAGEDARSFRRQSPGSDVRAIPNGVDIDFFRPAVADEPVASQLRLVFEGNMRYGPNVDAAVHFARDVFPAVLRTHPGAVFRIVGKDPTDAVRALAGPHIEVTGFVEDIRPSLVDATLFVSPLRTGAGIKNKILQAWAMGLPVLATSQSVGGLEIEPGRNIVLADGAGPFGAATSALLDDPARRALLGRAGRATVEAVYSWGHRADQFDALFGELVARRGKPARL